ncbi:MAG TPA: MarR family transcriptional regulator [Desulfotomaculum sp.]|nr:MarR family transcriptional regulator [Desulfotomaculum sp.]
MERKVIFMNNEEFILAEEIADIIWQLWRHWRLLSHPVKQGKITPEQYWILHVLYHRGPQRIKDLAARLGTGSSAVTIAVKRMERNNLVCRKRDRGDERMVTVHLTEQGQAVFCAWREERRRSLSALFEPLDEGEKRQLYSLLVRVSGRLEEGGVSGGCGCDSGTAEKILR